MHRPLLQLCDFIQTTVTGPNRSTSLPSYLPLRTVRLREAVPVMKAMSQAPGLAGLAQLAKHSADCLRLVTPLIPVSMRTGVLAGPLDEDQWCLIATNSAVAAKLRQLTPSLAAHLRTHGQNVQNIRIKISMQK